MRIAGGLTRRGFLGVAGAVVVAGCGEEVAGPRRGGQVRALFASGGAKETLDPHLQSLFVDIARTKAMFDKLVELGPDLEAVPRLAERWEAKAGGTVWRFILRPAEFHDGKDLTAEDVLFSLARILDRPERVAQASLAGIDLARSRAVDQRTVELTLRRPNAELPTLLAGLGTAIVPAGFTDPSKPVGTGPFRFESFQAGRSMVGRRFDAYWDGAPLIDELRVLSAEADARGNALRGGQAEYANDMTATFARTAGKSVQIVAAQGCTTQAIVMKTDRPPFDNPEAALALKLLADRQRLVDVVLSGRGVVGNDLFGKGFQYYPDDIAQRERDLDEARRLLRKTGLLNKPLEIYTADASAGFVEAATLFAEQAAEAGLKVTVATGNAETYHKDLLTKGVLGNHRSGAMPIPQYITDRLLSTSPFNATAWRRPDFDQQFGKAQATTDQGQRSASYRQLQQTVRDRGGLLVWGHPDFLIATASTLQGVQPVPPNTLDSARFDKVWLS